jgi:hypothetical protein
MAFENSVLRMIFGFKGEKVRGDWRKLYNDEIYDFSSSNIIRGDKIPTKEMGGACGTQWKKKNAG